MNENLPAETPSCSPVPVFDLMDQPTMTYNWVDVTTTFKEACETLKSGELINEPNFTLYEAMSAIEMMDPKMDSWMVGEKVKRKIYSFKQCVEKSLIKLDNFNPDELILMMDHCHSCILSWLDGQSLAQTVFTFLYLHDPVQIKSRCLKAFCFGVLKLCDTIMEKIDKARVFEEEDFQLMRYSFKFASELTTARVIGMLREVEDEYGRLIRSTKSKTQSSNVEETNAKQLTDYDAILRRIRFLRLFLQGLSLFGSKAPEQGQAATKVFNQMAENLKIMKTTAPLTQDTTSSDDTKLLVPGFEPLLNQRLLPPTFPRYTKLHTISETYQIYDEMLKRMILITSSTGLQNNNGFQGILDFIVKFSRSNTCVLTRSLVQIHVVATRFSENLHPNFEVFRESLKTFNAPPCLSSRGTLHQQPLVRRHVDNFLVQAQMTMTKVFQVYGHNYARQREKLAALMDNFNYLQDNGDRLDAEITEVMRQLDPENKNTHVAYLGGWSLYHTLKIMIEYVISGFVLELYSDHELHYIYWYLSEILLSWLLQALNRANNQLQADENLNEQSELRRNRSNKKSKRNKKKSVPIHAKEITTTQAWLSVGWGTFKAILGFTMSGKFASPDHNFDNESIRYEHRFSPFTHILTPPYLSYKQYQVMTDTSGLAKPPSPEDLFLSSSRHFNSAKNFCEKLPDCPDMQKLLLVSKTNLVVTKILSAGQMAHKKKIKLDFSAHRAFPIIKML